MAAPGPSAVTGYVLAGGRSSRMGRDKALLTLAGRPLVQLAVEKLRRVCGDVRLLSNNAALAAFAPVVPDLHPDCGPIGGIEAGMLDAAGDWSLFYPVDMPFLPAGVLDWWLGGTLAGADTGTRLAMFSVDGVPQPALAMLHRDMLPFVTRAVEERRFKLFPVLENAAIKLAEKHAEPLETVFNHWTWNRDTKVEDEHHGTCAGGGELRVSNAQLGLRHWWFGNLNTPEDFAAAEGIAAALDV